MQEMLEINCGNPASSKIFTKRPGVGQGFPDKIQDHNFINVVE